MKEINFDGVEIEFPVNVHFRIICETRDGVQEAVMRTASRLGVEEQLTEGNASSSGKYRTYQLSLLIETHEQMDKIDAGFRATEGVKMVL